MLWSEETFIRYNPFANEEISKEKKSELSIVFDKRILPIKSITSIVA